MTKLVKRSVALVLAVVMVMGLMVTGVSAAGNGGFTDTGDKSYAQAIEVLADAGITEEKLQILKGLPIWFVYSKDDMTVDPTTYEEPTIARLKAAGADVYTSIYEHVFDTTGLYKDPGGTPHLYYGGHSSWQYFFNNYCVDDATGVNMWEWMAEQSK